jgi:hypothetical protein
MKKKDCINFKPSRYSVYDPILNFYKRNPRCGYNELFSQDGYKYNYDKGMLNWFVKYIQRLEKKGYTHDVSSTEITGGDNDLLVIDHGEKKYCFWENGFYPFGGPKKEFPTTKNLKYWANCRG